MQKESADRSFVVVSRKVIFDNRLTAFDRLLLIHIGGFGEFYESTKKTAKAFGVSERTILESKRRLVEGRCIVELSNHGRGKSYIINEKYLWKNEECLWKKSTKDVQKYV